MKFIIFFLLLFWSDLLFAQKTNFIGEYNTVVRTKDNDTANYIYLSIDSIKDITAAGIKKKKNMWLRIESGSWSITKYDDSLHGWWALFKFNGGTSKEVLFQPFWPGDWRGNTEDTPAGYHLIDGGMIYTNFLGTGGLIKKVKGLRNQYE